jgi:hypothetical protein
MKAYCDRTENAHKSFKSFYNFFEEKVVAFILQKLKMNIHPVNLPELLKGLILMLTGNPDIIQVVLVKSARNQSKGTNEEHKFDETNLIVKYSICYCATIKLVICLL